MLASVAAVLGIKTGLGPPFKVSTAAHVVTNRFWPL